MWYPQRQQWWILWFAAGVALFIWWNGATEAAFERATTSPEYLQEQAQVFREQEQASSNATVLALAQSLASNRNARVARALAAERRNRIIGTVLVAAFLSLWHLESLRTRR